MRNPISFPNLNSTPALGVLIGDGLFPLPTAQCPCSGLVMCLSLRRITNLRLGLGPGSRLYIARAWRITNLRQGHPQACDWPSVRCPPMSLYEVIAPLYINHNRTYVYYCVRQAASRGVISGRRQTLRGLDPWNPLPSHERDPLPSHERDPLPSHEWDPLPSHERDPLPSHERDPELPIASHSPTPGIIKGTQQPFYNRYTAALSNEQGN